MPFALFNRPVNGPVTFVCASVASSADGFTATTRKLRPATREFGGKVKPMSPVTFHPDTSTSTASWL